MLSDLTEVQRERLQSTLSLRGLSVQDYMFEIARAAFLVLFCALRSSIENPSLRVSGQGRTFYIVDYGDMDQSAGYWVVDEETNEEGFLPEFEDVFWVFDDEVSAWVSRPFSGRNLRKGYGKGKTFGKGKGKFRFRPRKGGKGYQTQEYTETAAFGTGKGFDKGSDKGKSKSKGKSKGKMAE